MLYVYVAVALLIGFSAGLMLSDHIHNRRQAERRRLQRNTQPRAAWRDLVVVVADR